MTDSTCGQAQHQGFEGGDSEEEVEVAKSDQWDFSNLFGFETSIAELERTSWTFPKKIKLSSLSEENFAKFLSEDQESRGAIFKLLYVPWEPVSSRTPYFVRLPFPWPRTTSARERQEDWITNEHANLWQNGSGGSAYLTAGERIGFILQTPRDGGPFCSLSLLQKASATGYPAEPGSRGLYVADPIDFMILPVRILQEQVIYNRDELFKLIKKVNEVETRIATGNVPPNAETDNRILNKLSLEHLSLHQRWNFALELGGNMLRYFDAIANRSLSPGFEYSRIMREEVERQIRYSEQARYDFENLPRRIRNQSKAIFSIIAQRDNQLSIEISKSSRKIAEESRRDNQLNIQIAKSSARIAEESRRDSASMKTIAVLTLVFLPGTSIASIFSMTMFNWNASQGQPIASKYIWVYFVITIPLTLLILLTWLWWYKRSQRTHQRRWTDIETALELSDFSGLHVDGNLTPDTGGRYH
ncbi:uncharacterized protein K441DRAFT_89226 [Cenococcum geophilum 1.58]|uniref:uncharacterized protein n=1 Tax=Cenococcum geophilum 1.58 TaxID=794803 RepID=UPI00358FA053|nr:hypothetical protein K441DRAFT_89226 [Cenococcum geophilum 1.58]